MILSMEMCDFHLKVGDWDSCHHDATLVRHEVFVVEQSVPLDEELDDLDSACLHVVVYDRDRTPLGTGRLLPDGHIGRMAVRRSARGLGLGSKMLQCLVDEARRRGHLEVALAAQLHAQGFYARHGFVAEGAVFQDAGIPHVMMRRVLTA